MRRPPVMKCSHFITSLHIFAFLDRRLAGRNLPHPDSQETDQPCTRVRGFDENRRARGYRRQVALRLLHGQDVRHRELRKVAAVYVTDFPDGA